MQSTHFVFTTYTYAFKFLKSLKNCDLLEILIGTYTNIHSLKFDFFFFLQLLIYLLTAVNAFVSGQVIMAPIFTGMFISLMGALRGENLDTIKGKLERVCVCFLFVMTFYVSAVSFKSCSESQSC